MSHLNFRYSKILVGIDGSDDSMKAADRAMAIAKLHGAKLLTVYVIPSQMRLGGYSTSIATPTSQEYSKRVDEAADIWFERIKHNAAEAGVEVVHNLLIFRLELNFFELDPYAVAGAIFQLRHLTNSSKNSYRLLVIFLNVLVPKHTKM